MLKGRIKSMMAVMLMVFTCAVIMSGCDIIIHQEVQIEKDGSGVVTVRTLVDEEVKEYSEGSYDKYKYGGDTYYTDKDEEEEREFEDIDELQEILEENEFFTDLKLTKRSIKGTIDTQATLYEDMSSDQTQNMEEYGDYIKMAFTVTFPNKVVDTNGELSEDKKTVTWEYDLNDEEVEIYAKCSNPLLTVLIVLGVIILVAVAAFVIYMQIQKNKSNSGDNPFDYANVMQNQSASDSVSEAEAAPVVKDYSAYMPKPQPVEEDNGDLSDEL